MHEVQNRHRKSPGLNGSGSIGLLVGIIGLIAGTAWCVKNHVGNRSQPATGRQPSSGSHRLTLLLGAVGAGLAGVVVGAASNRLGNADARGSSDITLTSQVTINRSPEEIYQYWRDFQNLPRIMSFIERVEPREGNIYHWVARGPAGPIIEWDAEVVDDDPGKLLAWRSIEGSDLQTWGTVVFSPREGNRGTEVSVTFNFCPPATLTGTLAKFMSGLENSILDHNLRNLKSQLETGEIATSRRYRPGKEVTGQGQLS